MELKNKVLFVCMGNICRSPTAHAVMRAKANLAQINIEIDSAGTSGSHRAEAPDSRSVREGEKLGYDFSKIYSRVYLMNSSAKSILSSKS